MITGIAKNKIVFVPFDYWETAMGDNKEPTPEQWAKLEAICNSLNQKYFSDIPCPTHPDNFHKLSVYLTNGKLSIEFARADTCGCHDAMVKLAKVKEYEMEIYNHEH